MGKIPPDNAILVHYGVEALFSAHLCLSLINEYIRMVGMDTFAENEANRMTFKYDRLCNGHRS